MLEDDDDKITTTRRNQPQSLHSTTKMAATRRSFKVRYSSKENQNVMQSHYATPQRLRKQFCTQHGKYIPIEKGKSKQGSTFQPKEGSKFQAKNGKTTQLWENDELKAFSIFPSGVRYMPKKIRDKATLSIFLQNFPEEKSTLNLACKSDDMFPKPRTNLQVSQNKEKSMTTKERTPPCRGKQKGKGKNPSLPWKTKGERKGKTSSLPWKRKGKGKKMKILLTQGQELRRVYSIGILRDFNSFNESRDIQS
ncbi:hypothetical protein DVH24_019866 [Malus domestica]|uniref:Uncharacterized protein n=1 Tax=Malus domestica TaxID=3750 RepID=A0A498HZE3_MALDO|nr:hypothetical protein DVH24_019866 [Malus domestica]